MIQRFIEALNKPRLQMTTIDELIVGVPLFVVVMVMLGVGCVIFGLFLNRQEAKKKRAEQNRRMELGQSRGEL